MPQMSPMPWLMLLFWVIISMLYICSYVYFNNQMKTMHNPNSNKKIIFIKW